MHLYVYLYNYALHILTLLCIQTCAENMNSLSIYGTPNPAKLGGNPARNRFSVFIVRDIEMWQAASGETGGWAE